MMVFIFVLDSVNISVDEESIAHRIWTARSTKFFLELFKERKSKFRDPKIKKRTLWTDIMQEMHKIGYTEVNEDILDRKLRNLKKTYRSIKDNNNKSSTGRKRITWEYYDIFEELFSNDRTINYGSTISSLVPATDQPSAIVPAPSSILTNFCRSTPSPSTPSLQSSARFSLWPNLIDADSFIESNTDVNNSNIT